jgi:hypothetical protein
MSAEATLQLDGLADVDEDPRMPFLRRFARGEKITRRQGNILLAHSLIYDPHVDGRKRLTPAGRELLAEEGT